MSWDDANLKNNEKIKIEVSHSGHCDGNCSACPDHYGYRYGRWYYGHDHQYGCEFGGNRGSGSMD